MSLTSSEIDRLLTEEEVKALPEGTRIYVKVGHTIPQLHTLVRKAHEGVMHYCTDSGLVLCTEPKLSELIRVSTKAGWTNVFLPIVLADGDLAKLFDSNALVAAQMWAAKNPASESNLTNLIAASGVNIAEFPALQAQLSQKITMDDGYSVTEACKSATGGAGGTGQYHGEAPNSADEPDMLSTIGPCNI